MKPMMKWGKVALAAVMASALLVAPRPASHAESKISLKGERVNARKMQVIRQLESLKEPLKEQRKAKNHTAKSVTVNAVNEVTFANDFITYYDLHVYAFETASAGTLHVSRGAWNVDWIVEDQDGNVYGEGDPLPPGFYHFVVYSSSREGTSYSFTLSGIPMASVDHTVPKLTMTNPSEHVRSLPKGTTSMAMAGSHDGDQTIIFHEQGRLETNPSFSVDVPVMMGYNSIDVAALEHTGNFVVNSYFIHVPGVKRIAGADRYEVAANISKEMFHDDSGFPVVIARGDIFPDALSGGPLAFLEDAPILLSDYKTQSLPTAIQHEIRRLNPSRAIILGGTGSVGPQVEAQLKNLGIPRIERIDGPNRFAVSAKIADRMIRTMDDQYGVVTDTVIVASGLVFPDALSASSPAAVYGLPILQVNKDVVPSEIKTFIQTHPNLKNFFIVGGPGTVSETVKAELEKTAKSRGGQVERIGGANRYEVGVNIAERFPMNQALHVFAKGTDFPDALAGGPLAARMIAPMLLTPTDSLAPVVSDYLNRIFSKDLYYILGGIGSVSARVENQLDSTLK
ncbi:cell wall-binding repeat-containing protein [Staphylospora marina]|uniref:cell wall-binding repeat-containing protein n=1 Tax=Staphylospora marina TaxID=2490858 RepID=UPI000F5BC167|nr:cell wall-binding repeat-containing protein [Staphylospora marina]